jgi:hypothetical protein
MTDAETLHPLRPLLRNWVWEHGRIGTRYLDCAHGEIKFDDGKRARFADEKIFYVDLRKEADDVANAMGPTVKEGGLARFLRAAQLGNPGEAGPVADVRRAALDCVDLGLVCAYQREAQRAKACYALEPMFDDEIQAAVISDIRALYVGLREQLALYDFTVFYGLPAPLLICESPFIDWRVRAKPAQPFVSLPLGPYCLLVGTPSGKTSRVGPVLWKTATTMGPFKDHNRHIVDSARVWLVATTEDQLAAVQGRFAPAAAEQPEVTGTVNAERVANIGDTTLDLRAGHNAGVGLNIGMLSGAHDREMLAAEPHTDLLASVADLPALLAGAEPGAATGGGG